MTTNNELKGRALLQKEMNEFLEDPDMCDDFGVDYWDEENPNILKEIGFSKNLSMHQGHNRSLPFPPVLSFHTIVSIIYSRPSQLATHKMPKVKTAATKVQIKFFFFGDLTIKTTSKKI